MIVPTSKMAVKDGKTVLAAGSCSGVLVEVYSERHKRVFGGRLVMRPFPR